MSSRTSEWWGGLLVLCCLTGCQESSTLQVPTGETPTASTDVAQAEFERLRALEQGCCALHAEVAP